MAIYSKLGSICREINPENLCCSGSQTCCPSGNSYRCCEIENAVCCPDWGDGRPKCCFNFMQCAPNGSPEPCMFGTKPANLTFHPGFDLSPSFPADNVGP